MEWRCESCIVAAGSQRMRQIDTRTVKGASSPQDSSVKLCRSKMIKKDAVSAHNVHGKNENSGSTVHARAL